MRKMICWLALAILFIGGDARGQDPPSMWDHVTLYRDEWGTPHVYADSIGAMAFGFGYAQAEDHIEAMLLAYRVANGRAAEILGEPYAASDEFALIMGHGELAEGAMTQVDPVTRDLAEGFAMGVNAWIVDHPDRTPSWADGVKAADILALLHCYLMSFAPFHLPDTFHRAPATPSANAWAVGAPRSVTGEAMLFINPHADYTGPFQWYEAHLVAPGLNIAGATLFGLPVIMQGHNGVLGWALAPNQPNTADLYTEAEMRWAPTPGTIVSPMLQRQVEAIIAGMAIPKPFYVRHSDSLEERVTYRLETGNGPIVGRHGGQSCSYRVAGYRDFGALRQFFEMGRARNLGAFQEAMAMHQVPCFHVVYADQEGNIFYLYNAKVANRMGPGAFDEENDDENVTVRLDWDRPMPGDDPRYSWGPMVPVTSMPATVNPPSGFVQACGTPPWGATSGETIRQTDWPHWFVMDTDTYRARRVRHLLSTGQRSFADMQSMAYDVLVPFALRAVPKLQEIVQDHELALASLHPDVSLGLELLNQWNYVAEVDSNGMTFFHVWWASYQALAPNHPNETALHDAFVNGQLDPGIALEAMDRATRMMRNEFQSLTVPWGQVHRTGRGPREASLPGGQTGQPVFRATDSTFQEGRWRATGGYGFAMAVKFGPRVEAVSMLPFGTSENPNSPHYDDQLALMTERRFKVTRFYIEDVQRHARSGFGRVVQLRPRGMTGSVQLRSQYPVTARLESSATAPAPLPVGFAPYTVFVTPRQEPIDVPSVVDLEIHVPIELFPQERFHELAVYAYDEGGQWRPVQAQRSNPQQRTLLARDRGQATYAVLGPSIGLEQLPLDDAPQPLIARVPDSALPPEGDPEIPELPPIAFPPTDVTEAVPADPTTLEVESDWPETMEPVGEAEAPAEEESAPLGDPVSVDVVREPSGAAIAWGRIVELTPPGVDGFIRIAAERAIGVRLQRASEPPAPLPEGHSMREGFWVVESSSNDISMEVTVRMAVSGANAAEAVLYGYSEEGGWTPLANQEFDENTGILASVDRFYPVYAILVADGS